MCHECGRPIAPDEDPYLLTGKRSGPIMLDGRYYKRGAPFHSECWPDFVKRRGASGYGPANGPWNIVGS